MKVEAIGGRHVLSVEALDRAAPIRLDVVVPPEEVNILLPETLQCDTAGLDSFTAWSRAHRILQATAVRETGLVSGARFGRVSPELYQFAPALRVLAKPRASLLVADDVGLGKTIEAGLLLLELMARGRAGRVLVVTPPGLMHQWRDEMREKFGLEFRLIENSTALAREQESLPAGLSPWDALPRVITSMDYLKKETVRARALRRRWDLAIVDEAHALAESGTSANPYRTRRTRLGLELSAQARGLILLTATPHNGYSHSFRSLVQLVEPTAAALSGDPVAVVRRMESARIRRMKSQIRRRLPDGREEEIFPKRTVRGLPVVLTDAREANLLGLVSSYCSRTAREAGDEEESGLITFAMQIIKKRALSSRWALERTIEHRLAALKKEDEREEPPDWQEIRDLQADLPLGEAAAERTARRILRAAIPKEERRRKSEIAALNKIRKALKALPAEDPKIRALTHELREVFSGSPDEKVIVFTEYLDTLEAVGEAFDADAEMAGRYVILRGGLTPRQRLRRQAAFEKTGTRVLLATDAASEGLNLQRTCRRVVHVELPWNPNRLEQRNGRVDRYGQTRPPIIRYLFYPHSPEDDVLHRLVEKIEQIAGDRISTPDILGVLSGMEELSRELVTFDPDRADLQRRKDSLVRLFEDRTDEFIRSSGRLMSAAGAWEEERSLLVGQLDRAGALLDDDLDLESLVLDLLGSAVEPSSSQGIFRISVPHFLRGPGVAPIYPAATLRRSVAVRHRADQLEYLTPLHPLVQAMAAEARRRLLQVYPDDRGMPPRRLAARSVPSEDPPSILFTFFGTIRGGADLHEENLLMVRLDLAGKIAGGPRENLALLLGDGSAGEVQVVRIQELFGLRFEDLAASATDLAGRQLAERALELRRKRAAQAEELRRDLETDIADRLAEIEAEEKEARTAPEDAAGQRSLFGPEDRSRVSHRAQREAVATINNKRREEIAEFEIVNDPKPPAPMVALFLVPAGSEKRA